MLPIALIGPAGENLVKYACVVTEGRQRNAFGRGGAGAVMGSKNLKAVAVHGTGDVPIADKAALREAQRFVNDRLAAVPEWKIEQRKYGTRGALVMLNTGRHPADPSVAYRAVQGSSDVRAGEHQGGLDRRATRAARLIVPTPATTGRTVKEGEYAGATRLRAGIRDDLRIRQQPRESALRFDHRSRRFLRPDGAGHDVRGH